VPLPSRPDAPNRSSLVWVVKPEDVEKYLNQKHKNIEQYIENKVYVMWRILRMF